MVHLIFVAFRVTRVSGKLFFIFAKCDSVPIGAFKVLELYLTHKYAIFIFALIKHHEMAFFITSDFDNVVGELKPLIWVALIARLDHHA